MSSRFTYAVIASALHDAGVVDELTAPIRALMDELGGRRTSGHTATAPVGRLPHVLLVATGGTERGLLDEVAHRRVTAPNDPAVLVAHRAHNSLPAALETLAAVQQGGNRGRIAYLTGGHEDRQTLDDAVADLEAVVRLRSTRIGLIGGPSSWLVASSPDPRVVQRRWGPHVQIVEASDLIERTQAAPVDLTTKSAARFSAHADRELSTVDDHCGRTRVNGDHRSERPHRDSRSRCGLRALLRPARHSWHIGVSRARGPQRRRCGGRL